ncbi:MAG TPA: hypothetical protein VLA97_11235 [Nocardioidaceae bacterium]|jgi:hypothetical protein|nr:hypothetical protein [Nocardioidaceae bacterium]
MRTELTITELESQHFELLPPRETLSSNWANVYAYNSSTALNVATEDFAEAESTASQYINVEQD